MPVPVEGDRLTFSRALHTIEAFEAGIAVPNSEVVEAGTSDLTEAQRLQMHREASEPILKPADGKNPRFSAKTIRALLGPLAGV